LEDLELIVNRMNAIFRGEEMAIRIKLLTKLIERRAPELVPICHILYQLSDYRIDKFKQLAHLCETPEEISLYNKIVPKTEKDRQIFYGAARI
jgi:hypothetical protein